MLTVVIGNNTGDDYSGAEFNYLWVNGADNVYNDPTWLYINGPNERCNDLMIFTGLSNLPSGITVSDASIYIIANGCNHNVEYHRCLRNWVYNQATYNVYSTGNSWTTAGAMSDGNDRAASATVTRQWLTSETGDTYYSVGDFSADVEDFANGTYINYGWVAQSLTSYGNWNGFRTNSASDGQRPYLSVTYTESGAGGPLIGASALVGGGVLCGQGNLIN